LPREFDVSELPLGFSPGSVLAHPTGDEFLRSHFQMKAQLRVDVVGDLSA
jgi:hypothetical protein